MGELSAGVCGSGTLKDKCGPIAEVLIYHCHAALLVWIGSLMSETLYYHPNLSKNRLDIRPMTE